MISIELNLVHTMILTIILYLLGTIFKKYISIFNKFCIPAPVIGGLFFCFLNLILRIFNICYFTMNTSLMPYFMTMFFTIIGLGVNFSLIKKGGKTLIIYWILCGILTFAQNTLAVSLSKLIGINPLLGLMCGTISMVGGHGYSAAFGATIESLGINGATSFGITSATLGLIIGGVIGGPVSKFLIEKYKLKPKPLTSINLQTSNKSSNFILSPLTFFVHMLVILLAMSVGELIVKFIQIKSGIIIPLIVGAMFFAVIFRNINDKVGIIKLDFNLLDFLNEICLGLFLTMALMSIDLFKLSSLFGPILILVSSQVLFMLFFTIFICFKLLGKDFDAAVLVSGIIGHGLGATPNALANMSSVCQKYGNSPKAFLIVPLVAGFLLDIFTMPSILFFINILS